MGGPHEHSFYHSKCLLVFHKRTESHAGLEQQQGKLVSIYLRLEQQLLPTCCISIQSIE